MKYTDKFFEITSPAAILDQLEERDNLDFKSILDGSHKGKADFLKDFAAIANHGGGAIVYGVKGRDAHGIEEADLPNYDPSRLHDKLKAHLSPVPKVIVQIVDHGGKKFPFVKIAGINEAPVLVSKNMHDEKSTLLLCEGELFFRQNTQTIKASSEAHVRHILDVVITAQVANRIASITPVLRQLGGAFGLNIDATPAIEIDTREFAKTKPGISGKEPVRMAVLVPKGRSEKFSGEILKKAFALKAGLHGHHYPHYAETNQQFAGVTRLNNGYASWWGLGHKEKEWRCVARQHEDGAFCWMGTLFEDEVGTRQESGREGKFKTGIGVLITQYFVHLALQHAQFYLKELGDTGLWTFTYRLANVADRSLFVEKFDRMDFYGDNKKSFENSIEIKLDLKEEMLANDMENLVVGTAASIFERFNWTQPNTTQMRADFRECAKLISKEQTPMLR